MQFLTKFSLRNPVAIVIFVLLIAIGGILSTFGLQEDLMPDMSIPIISIMTTYPGASPSQVATDVTTPIEKALNGAKDVQNITSTSVANVSQIELQLNMSADLDKTMQNVEQIVNQVQLPTTANKPSVRSFSFSNTPVLEFTVASSKLTSEQLKNLVNDTVVPSLQGVAGVATPSASGADADNVMIQFDPAKLAKYNLSLQQVLQDLQADNASIPLGTATADGKVQPVQLNAAFKSLTDIQNLQIGIPSNAAAGMQKAIGNSMSQMGQSIGQLAQGVGQLGGSMSLLEAQNQILASLQQIQGQIFGAELALNQQMAMSKASLNSNPKTGLNSSNGAAGQGATSPTRGTNTVVQVGGGTNASTGSNLNTSAGAGQNQQTIVKLQGEISALESVQTKLQLQLKQIQSKMKMASGSMSAKRSSTVKAAASSNTSSTSSTLDTIPLSDLATVSMQPPNGSSINRTNGQPSILMTVSKTEDANTVTVVKDINKQLASLKKQLPNGVKIVSLFDSSQMITASVNGMVRESVLGAVFAILVILFFLRNWLTTVVAVVSIPISILASIILLSRYGVTLNIMTLGGLAVATGRVVDDSIVVIENIYRTWKTGLGFGKKLVLHATAEVGNAILSSTLATIAVFAPLAMVGGMVGKIFFPFALTVVCSLASSLIVALTIVPILAWLFVVRKPAKGMEYEWLETGDDLNGAIHPELMGAESRSSNHPFVAAALVNRPWQKRYQSVLNWCLNHKGWVIIGTVIAFAASLMVLPFVGSTFIQNSMQQTASISISMPVGTPLNTTDAKAKQVEEILKQDAAQISRINTSVGGGGAGFSPRGGSSSNTNTATLNIALNANVDVNQFLDQARKQLASIAVNGTTIQVKGQMTGGGGTTFDLVINGPNDTAISQAVIQVTKRLQNEPGLANVKSNLADTQPEISVAPDSGKAAQYGLTSQQVANVVRSYLSQQNIGTVNMNGQTYNLNVQMSSSTELTELSAIRGLPINTSTGQSITVGDVATVSDVQTPTTVLHQNGKSYAEITADYTTQNTGKTLRSVLKDIKTINLPSGVQVGQSTSAMQQSQSFTQLIEAILVAVGMVYIVMLILFGGWSAPFAILFSMPVALIGAFLGTFIAHQPLSVSSLIGILMLMGIVVTNAIVLIQRVEQQRALGMTVRDALLEAGTTRLRPILMTAVATICALLPLAVGASEGVLISQGLAVVVIGGLFTSTILTLCIVPLVYELLHLRTHRKEREQNASIPA
ncbi:efflux RND transporter permease subunit [Bacillus sp. BRMEA1]|uniref:efflux RND transporter permease subunit n=1 Tax=Neobacillus endophyticus TaxID=2738405 RepID=UPI001563ADC5|nr:efflux RND transporter permease subunit [Neobacillus endophyticus]NRD78016.1 efflux RND transporter permease subunit [Neobacillus endophyticus]